MAEITELGLATSQQDFDRLHQAADKVRVDVNFVTVNKQALLNLLYDHSQFVGLCEDDLREYCRLVHGDTDAVGEASRAYSNYRRGAE